MLSVVFSHDKIVSTVKTFKVMLVNNLGKATSVAMYVIIMTFTKTP